MTSLQIGRVPHLVRVPQPLFRPHKSFMQEGRVFDVVEPVNQYTK